MLKHDLTIALRRFAKQRFHTAIGAAVLTLGLICFITANVFVGYVRNFDRQWSNADRTYVVAERIRNSAFGIRPSFDTGSDAPIAELLRVEAPELSAVAWAHFGQQLVSVDDRRVLISVAYVEPEFTEVFALTTLSGVGAQAFAAPRSAVVTQHAAERLFGARQVTGRRLTVLAPQPVDLTVTAVVADLPDQSHLKRGGLFSNGADVFFSWDVLEASAQPAPMSWGSRRVKTYALLPADGSLTKSELDRRLAKIAAERVPTEWQFLDLELESRPVSAIAALAAQSQFQGFWGAGVWVDVLSALRVAAAAILAIACVNFLNLALAQGTARVVDVSTRKVLGARTSQIVVQDLVQTALVVALAVLLALAVVVPLASLFTAPVSLSLEIPWSEPWFIAFVGATLCGVTAAAGLYPALVGARARRAAAASVHGGRDALARIRTGLVGLQFATASALVVAAVVLVMQRNELHGALVGRFPDQYVGLFTAQSAPTDRAVLANELKSGPGILGTTAMDAAPFYSLARRFSRTPDEGAPSVMVNWIHTGDDYFDVMEVPLVAGRVFAPDRADDEVPRTGEEWTARRGRPPSIVLDRIAVHAFGWPEPAAALGELVYGPGGGPHEIVGIVEPVVTSIRAAGTSGSAYVFSRTVGPFQVVRIASDRVGEALAHIDASVKAALRGQPTSRLFFDQIFEGYHRTFDITNRVLTGLAAFALLISGIGLFGMASYMANRRTREIGIRKVQGASPGKILRLLLWDFSRPVVWANLAAWPLALIALDRYLNVFADRVEITPLPFALALVATWFLACLAVVACAWRAAKLLPAEALRD